MASPGLKVAIQHYDLDGSRALQNLALTLPAGRFTCLLGPSGIGKTSLIKLIAGLWPGASVQADDGKAVTGRLAMMAQQDQLLPWLTCRENVLLGPALRGEKLDTARADALLAAVGLPDVAGRRPQTLSGGMRQRVAIARTLMEDRAIVLMDEPFSALDAVTRHQLQDLAFRLLKGRTVLLVTHSPLEALRLADQLLILGGDPPTLTAIDLPDEPPLRAIDDPAVLQKQAELMSLLLEATGSEQAA